MSRIMSSRLSAKPRARLSRLVAKVSSSKSLGSSLRMAATALSKSFFNRLPWPAAMAMSRGRSGSTKLCTYSKSSGTGMRAARGERKVVTRYVRPRSGSPATNTLNPGSSMANPVSNAIRARGCVTAATGFSGISVLSA